ncbi:hypothetical protein BDV38DRAFT_258275 [Aspergillus pseudotamarii]|uniref:Uncharacterized protein n=1 Tax=Aspergillus pseudotamarii TaxID=132259 RepID=A0A5N6SHL1_ASPPS|nr:uncharacterized protein BDV38DRAFT_258275 [Aspergillus pseudotamarii]KAE8133369.1 hypothetical protein BDV38DRAFT_258275 [Aspergillus pseudotamarii]
MPMSVASMRFLGRSHPPMNREHNYLVKPNAQVLMVILHAYLYILLNFRRGKNL